MANLGSATVVVNLSCEMVYIVAQRLRDQGYAPDVAAKCLCGMLGALAHPAFADALFALGTDTADTGDAGPAADDVLGDRGALQAVLQQLCSCSFLLLGEDSMARMLDIQLMTFKYQAMSAASLRAVTRTHLDAMLALAAHAGHSGVRAALAALRARFESAFGRLGAGDDADLRMRVLAFLQDKRAEVGMLLADGKMAEDLGTNYSAACTEGVPARGERPGTVRCYDVPTGTPTRTTTFDPAVAAPGSFRPPADYFEPVPSEPPLGGDMFAASEEAVAPPDETPPCPPSDDEDGVMGSGGNNEHGRDENDKEDDDGDGDENSGGGDGNTPITPEGVESAKQTAGNEAPIATASPTATSATAPATPATPTMDADGDADELMMARNNAIAAALKSLDTVMSNLPAPKIAGPRYNPHHPTDGPQQRHEQKQEKPPLGTSGPAESDLLGKLDELAAVTEQPTEESLQSALHDLSVLDGAAPAATGPSTSADALAALSDLTALAPADDADMASALASLDSIAAAAPAPASTASAHDELSAALLGVEAHPDAADLSALSMLDSVAQSRLQQEPQPALTADSLSSALTDLSGDSTATAAAPGTSGGTNAEMGGYVSLAALSDALSALGGAQDSTGGDLAGLDLNGIDLSGLDALAGDAQPQPQPQPPPSSAVFDLSGLGDF